MATIVFSAIGLVIGGPIGGAIGALAGSKVDKLIFGGGTREGSRLSELAVTTSSYGIPVPRLFGRMRSAGQVIWATDLVEHREKQGNGKGKPSTINYSYTASFAVALSSRPIVRVGRIWADGKLLRGAADDLKVGGILRVHTGHGDQPADPLIAGLEGAANCPAYRGLAYAVFEDLDVGEYGNRIPALSFEVFADEGALALSALFDGAIDNVDAEVPLDGLAGLSQDGPYIEALAALDPLYPVDCDGCGEALTIRPDRLFAVPFGLPESATSDEDGEFGGNAGFARHRRTRDSAAPGVLRYYDVERDYLPGTQRAMGRPVAGQPQTVELPAALDAGNARRLIEAAAGRAQWGRQTVSWRVTQLDPEVRPGTQVTLPGTAGLWRVAAWEWRAKGVELGLERIPSGLAGGAFSSDPGRSNPPPDLALPVTRLAACELPWDGNPNTSVPYLLAAVSSPGANWAGANLYVDQGDGALQPIGQSGRDRATIGIAVNVLPAANPLLFDRSGTVTIALAGDDLQLSDATMRQLAMGANRALLGNEIVQFLTAVPLGAGQWRLEGLWRGRGGTESATSGHVAGEAFILFDGSGVALDPALVGSVPGTQLAAIGQADIVPVTAPVALRGIGLRPPAPVHGRIEALAGGDIQLRWVRRARGGWLWLDGVETPLDEQQEFYTIAFGPASAPLASWETSGPQLVVAAAQLAALAALAPSGPFTIRQRGDRGVSEALSLPLA